MLLKRLANEKNSIFDYVFFCPQRQWEYIVVKELESKEEYEVRFLRGGRETWQFVEYIPGKSVQWKPKDCYNPPDPVVRRITDADVA